VQGLPSTTIAGSAHEAPLVGARFETRIPAFLPGASAKNPQKKSDKKIFRFFHFFSPFFAPK
jgi:hypothetical protein